MPKQEAAQNTTQQSMYYSSVNQSARADETFLVLVKSGMTRSDLEGSIKRRPSLWSRYANWLDKLPESRAEKMRGEAQA